MAGIAAVGSTYLAGYPAQKPADSFDPLNEKGIHPVLEKDHPYIFKDVTGIYNKHITSNIRSPMRMVDGFSNYAEVLNFIEKLKKHGYSENDVRKILGGNYLRVFSKVWK